MHRKNSIFIKIFIPVIAVMLLQISTVSIVLNVNGTVGSLENAALTTLARNTENRGATLEQMMVFYWSNLDRLEMGVTEQIDAYLKENNLSIDRALGDYDHEISMLDSMSQILIDALRASASTGIYIVFLDKEGYREEVQNRNGLHYRDRDPLSNPTDNSDIIYMKGFVDIARKDRIQLDSLWSEDFTFDPDDEDIWRGFSNPQKAAAQYPGAPSANLAYWNSPHLLNPRSVIDANKCITYTRPVFFGGRPVALIGTEVHLVHLEKQFPASDFESDGQGGYMLIGYDVNEEGGEQRSRVYHTTGSYIRRLIGSDEDIILTPTRRDGIYSVSSASIGEGVEATQRPLRIYNSNSPFASEMWALAALGTDSMLFATARNVNIGILFSSILAFGLGAFLLVITIRRTTRPLISIAAQIEESSHEDNEDRVFETDSNTYEIKLLCSTLNTMREHRSIAEALVREERQRYLVALESAADTFLEYDAQQDSFMLYYFTDEADKKLSSKTIPQFTQAVSAGEFCHADDKQKMLDFLHKTNIGTVEIRSKTSVFSHISGVEPDGGYYWFMLKASNIFDDEGNVSKIIGTAKEITREKLEEFAIAEASQRDPVTKFYNRSSGIGAIEKKIADAGQSTQYFMCAVYIENFDKIESFYGRVFGGFVLMEFAHAISDIITEHDIAVRLSNDKFLFCFRDTDKSGPAAKVNLLENTVESIYAGENTNIPLHARIRVVNSTDEINNSGYADKPANITLDVDRTSIVSATFDLFERSTDTRSSINILIRILGRMFNFSRIAICSFETEFSANHVSYQWTGKEFPPFNTGIERISQTDLATFESMLDENGTLSYTIESISGFNEGILKLLCSYTSGGSVKPPQSAFCCVMRDGAAHIGRALFMSDNEQRHLTKSEKHDLCDIVKIISSNISIAKSQSASRAKSEFLSRISHEIRTPMNTIIGMTDIAKSVIDDPERLLDSLNHIDFSAKHLLNLINDVLEMSRIESGKLSIENKPFTLDTLASGVETLMSIPIESKDISFSVIRDYTRSHVVGDEYRLRQVILNLLSNANKFTEEGGAITFTIMQLTKADSSEIIHRRDGKEYGVFMFSVADTGVGISPEDQKLVFEAFGQGTSFSEFQHQGTGLGLSISESIISAMGSTIELESSPGRGSNFYFTLDLELRETDETLQDNESTDIDYKDRFKGKRALLVDDVKSNIAVASFVLEETGIEIDVASDGQQAVDMYFDSPDWYYDIIFMDVKMPVMDGIAATKKIRGTAWRPDSRDIPIVAMTANAYDEDMKKTVESGMNGHVTKPIVKEDLFELMEKLIVRN